MTRNLSVTQLKPPAKVGPKLSRAEFDDLVCSLTVAGDNVATLSKAMIEVRAEHRPASALALLDKRLSLQRIKSALNQAHECRVVLDRTYDDEAEDDAAYLAAVGIQIAKLLGAYPNANPSDPEVYVGCLIEDVVAAAPMLVSLQEAVQRLRKRYRFPPTVSEVLAVVAEVEDELWPGTHAAYRLDTIAEQASQLRTELIEKVRIAGEKAAAAARLQAEISRAFPIGSLVLHQRFGLGEVKGHQASFVEARWTDAFDRSQHRHVAASELLSVETLQADPQPGDRVAHFERGSGTVVELDTFGELIIDFDDGTRGRQVINPLWLYMLVSERPMLAPPGTSDIQVGQTVRHTKFGQGTVEVADGQRLEVLFQTGGRKILLASFVTIELEAAE